MNNTTYSCFEVGEHSPAGVLEHRVANVVGGVVQCHVAYFHVLGECLHCFKIPSVVLNNEYIINIVNLSKKMS